MEPIKHLSSTQTNPIPSRRAQFARNIVTPYLKMVLMTTHTTSSRTPLSLSLSLAPEIIVLLFLVPRERKGDVFFLVFWGLSLSRSLSRTFSSISKKLYQVVHTLLSHSLSHTHTNSAKSMRRWYATAFLFAHSSERVVVLLQRKRRKGIRFNFCLKTPELMIFERKKAKLPLARNERNETRAICFRGEKSFRARKRKNCQKQSERKKCSNDEISTPHSTVKKRLVERRAELCITQIFAHHLINKRRCPPVRLRRPRRRAPFF